jgi:hypothetical protein
MKNALLKYNLLISILFILISIILYFLVDWNSISKGENLIKELRLPTLFFFLGAYQLISYLSNRKGEKDNVA